MDAKLPKSRSKISKEEYDRVKKYFSEGLTRDEISKLTSRSLGVIDRIKRAPPEFENWQRSKYYIQSVIQVGVVEEDLSNLPDTVLFKHDSYYL